MSKKSSDSANDPSADEPLTDLSALDFGPAWARKDEAKKSRQQKGERSDRSGKKPSRPPRQGGSRHQGGRQDRRGQGGKPARGKHGDRSPRKPQTQPAEGVVARIMPIEEGIDGIAKEIGATGRTHSVFDLAWLVLGGLERFHVIFEKESDLLYKSNKDHSVWLTKQDCLRHFWSSGQVSDYYDEDVSEGEAPSGNFQSVARCGLSGKLIGPPNHHSYQQALIDLHRERFSNMPLDRYKSKIKMEHGEESVAEWIEQEKKQLSWKPKVKKDEESTADEVESEKEAAEVEESAVVDENAAEETVQDAEVKAEAEETGEGTPEEVSVAEEVSSDQPDEVLPIFKSRREVEQHFLEHGFGEAYYAGKSVSTPANIPAKLISPGLLATMRETIAEEKRYPGKLASFLCRQMTGRHLAVFKWKKRLHCGPARPKHVPDDMVMAERPSKLFNWVLEHPSGDIETMWKDCLPEGVDDSTRHVWYHDLHWLINEGFVLLFSDGTLHAAKELKPKAPRADKAEQPPTGDKAVEEKAAEGAVKQEKKSAEKQVEQEGDPSGEENGITD